MKIKKAFFQHKVSIWRSSEMSPGAKKKNPRAEVSGFIVKL